MIKVMPQVTKTHQTPNPEESPVEVPKEKTGLKLEAESVKTCIFSVEQVLDEELTEAEIRRFLIDLKSVWNFKSNLSIRMKESVTPQWEPD